MQGDETFKRSAVFDRPLSGPVALVLTAWERWREERRRQARIRELLTLDDELLADIGLRRQDIEVALKSTVRRMPGAFAEGAGTVGRARRPL